MPRITEDNIGDMLPSNLLLAALNDLARCEGDPRYSVDMNDWHLPDFATGICSVCLGGAVMAKSLNVLRTGFYGPFDFYSRITRPLRALDMFRQGRIVDGVRYLGFIPDKIKDRKITSYFDDRKPVSRRYDGPL